MKVYKPGFLPCQTDAEWVKSELWLFFKHTSSEDL